MIRRATAVFLAALLPLLAGAGQAQAAGYRYWSFWERSGTAWTYATQGPSLIRPADGDVQGFRFSVSENSADAVKPRGTADFDTICAKTKARDGDKRVALVLDFGTPADAPSGETPPDGRTACAQVPEDATTAEALAAVAGPLRYDTNALLCAIADYPKKGCGEQISEKDPTAPPENNASPSDSGPSVGLMAGIAVVAALAAAAIWQARRRA
ncbi:MULTISPECIES: SCO2322 family protein [unclassified Streptomyces]|uniref:SCO2322 family protein n=1 Tax=unclassified Streptomyces TaxID=2593676 RepID=UPI000F6D8325|nr:MULTISPECIES: SCO2322 family protein [unclassified Streptomyces]AZM62578.1 hypothetical protein DLM49_26330 [Streptomyces sp. WAC 01438]RSM90934.1 hypothetical protein DMA10_28400 [Streptomyces sp. WAC 01420]